MALVHYRLIGLLLGVLSPLVSLGATPPGSLTLAWNPVPDPDVAGYNLYYGTASRVYTDVVAVGDTNQVTISGLVPGVTYYLAATTRLITGLESAYSDEISFTIPTSAPVLQQSVSASGEVNLTASAPPGHTYDVLATEDFALWLAIGAVAVDTNGWFGFTDPDASQYPWRFYQLHETTYTPAGSLPVFDSLTTSDTGVQAQVSGQVGHTYEILLTLDFKVWGVIGAITIGRGGTGTITLPPDSAFPFSYYSLRETDYASAQTVVPFSFYTVLPGYVQVMFNVVAGPTYAFLETADYSTWNLLTDISFATDGMAGFADLYEPPDAVRIYRIQVSN